MFRVVFGSNLFHSFSTKSILCTLNVYAGLLTRAHSNFAERGHYGCHVWLLYKPVNKRSKNVNTYEFMRLKWGCHHSLSEAPGATAPSPPQRIRPYMYIWFFLEANLEKSWEAHRNYRITCIFSKVDCGNFIVSLLLDFRSALVRNCVYVRDWSVRIRYKYFVRFPITQLDQSTWHHACKKSRKSYTQRHIIMWIAEVEIGRMFSDIFRACHTFHIELVFFTPQNRGRGMLRTRIIVMLCLLKHSLMSLTSSDLVTHWIFSGSNQAYLRASGSEQHTRPDSTSGE